MKLEANLMKVEAINNFDVVNQVEELKRSLIKIVNSISTESVMASKNARD